MAKTEERENKILLEIERKTTANEVVQATFRSKEPPKRFIGQKVKAEIQLKKGPKEIDGILVDVI